MFPSQLIWAVVRALFTKRTGLVAENLALRQQLIVQESVEASFLGTSGDLGSI